MITDFSEIKNEFFAFYLIFSNCKNGVDKVTLRNKSNKFGELSTLFPNETILKMKEILEKIFPEKEFFLHDPSEKEIEAYSHFHFSEKRFQEAVELKKRSPEKRVAVSLHTHQECQKAFEKGIDFAFLSPIFKPISKPNDTRKCVKPLSMKNLFLLGGIDKKRAKQLISCGYKNIAAVSLFCGEKRESDVKELSEILNKK